MPGVESACRAEGRYDLQGCGKTLTAETSGSQGVQHGAVQEVPPKGGAKAQPRPCPAAPINCSWMHNVIVLEPGRAQRDLNAQ